MTGDDDMYNPFKTHESFKPPCKTNRYKQFSKWSVNNIILNHGLELKRTIFGQHQLAFFFYPKKTRVVLTEDVPFIECLRTKKQMKALNIREKKLNDREKILNHRVNLYDERTSNLNDRGRNFNNRVNLYNGVRSNQNATNENFKDTPFIPSPNFLIHETKYSNITEDIPKPYQKPVYVQKIFYIVYAFIMIINIIGAVTYAATQKDKRVAHLLMGLILSIITILFAFHFVFWSTYMALRSNNKVIYIRSIISMLLLLLMNLMQVLGFKGSGWSGLFVMLDSLNKNHRSIALIIICSVCIPGFLISGLYNLVMLLKIRNAFLNTRKALQTTNYKDELFLNI